MAVVQLFSHSGMYFARRFYSLDHLCYNVHSFQAIAIHTRGKVDGLLRHLRTAKVRSSLVTTTVGNRKCGQESRSGT